MPDTVEKHPWDGVECKNKHLHSDSPQDELIAAARRLFEHGQCLGGCGSPYGPHTGYQVQWDELAVGAAFVETVESEELASRGAATMLRYAERVTALYRQEREKHRPPHFSSVPDDHPEQPTFRYDAETEANLKAAMLPEMASSSVAADSQIVTPTHAAALNR